MGDFIPGDYSLSPEDASVTERELREFLDSIPGVPDSDKERLIAQSSAYPLVKRKMIMIRAQVADGLISKEAARNELHLLGTDLFGSGGRTEKSNVPSDDDLLGLIDSLPNLDDKKRALLRVEFKHPGPNAQLIRLYRLTQEGRDIGYPDYKWALQELISVLETIQEGSI